MFNSRSAVFGLLVIALSLNLGGSVFVSAAPQPAAMSEPSRVQVTLSSANRTTSWDMRDENRQKFELPVLYLHREREATEEADRSLTIQLSGLPAGTEIGLELVSHHVDVTTGTPYTETKRVITPNRPCNTDDPCSVMWTLNATTPSDLFYLRVKDRAGETLWENRERPAFAALDTWSVSLGDYEARVTYATLFPYARGQNDLEHRLPPEQVPAFIGEQFVPIIAETWKTQFVAWGFGEKVHPDWDDDNLLEVVVTDPPFALLDGTGTYTRFTGNDGRPYPHRRIWWFSSNNAFQAYDTLENGYRAVFAHEFFHTMQWNVLLSTERPKNLWVSWIEAQGRFASTVQYPELELSREHVVAESSAYASGSNRFLTGHLNTSYSELEADEGYKYDGALYWRFLYEQYHDMSIVRAALEAMAYHYDADTVNAMRNAMDAAFARVDGPFRTFEESLIAFSRANYALRLENQRCAARDHSDCGGSYYDPERVYADPAAEAELKYDGTTLTYGGAIPSSYGTDFVEVTLDRAVHDQPLAVEFQGEGEARFHVQVWKLGPGVSRPRAVTPRPEIVPQNPDGAHVYVIPSVDWMAHNRLALIITRLDPDESTDPVGEYQVTVGKVIDARLGSVLP